MPDPRPDRVLPGNSILGGAACGLSYEGALRDAMAAEERERRQEAGHLRHTLPPAQQRRWHPEREAARRPQ